jgi:hypothetical protein
MNRILFLLPLIALLGCDAANSTTPPADKPGSRATSTARPQATTRLLETSTPRAESARTATPADPPAKTEDPPVRPVEFEERKEDPPEEAPPIPDEYKPINKAKTIFFEKKDDGTRRVHLLAEVCLREGPLEVFLCKNFTKEHEAILRCDADAREIHAALLLTGAEAGNPAKFVPKFQPPTGTKIKVSVTFREKGKVKTVPASEWVKDKVSGKDLMYDWVFAGSRLFRDPENPGATPFYMANNGEVISLSNFPDSMMDLPVKSSKDAADLLFEANTSRIPPLRSPVLVTLEPVVEKKK